MVERKSLADLVSSLISGKLRYALGDVVEDRYSQVFKLDWVRPAAVADGLAELQIRWPTRTTRSAPVLGDPGHLDRPQDHSHR